MKGIFLFVAIAASASDDTAAIQKMIDAAVAQGRDEITVPAGRYHLAGVICLPPNFTFSGSLDNNGWNQTFLWSNPGDSPAIIVGKGGIIEHLMFDVRSPGLAIDTTTMCRDKGAPVS